MITVLQCVKCNAIVGDTDVPILASQEDIEVKHAVAASSSRNNRIKCETCGEFLGTEDSEGKFFYQVKAVRRYTVQSALNSAGTDTDSQPSKKKRRPGEEEFVSLKQFEKFKQAYMLEMLDVKETIMSLYERLDGR